MMHKYRYRIMLDGFFIEQEWIVEVPVTKAFQFLSKGVKDGDRMFPPHRIQLVEWEEISDA